MADVPADDGALEYGDEAARVEAWRTLALIDAGFPPDLADRLAAAPHVDWHRAVELLENGCTVELAAEILL